MMRRVSLGSKKDMLDLVGLVAGPHRAVRRRGFSLALRLSQDVRCHYRRFSTGIGSSPPGFGPASVQRTVLRAWLGINAAFGKDRRECASRRVIKHPVGQIRTERIEISSRQRHRVGKARGKIE